MGWRCSENIERETLNTLYENILLNVYFTAFGNIALDFGTDGVTFFKTSKTSMYPLVGSIFDLPPNVRTKKNNMALLELYVGKKKIDNLNSST